jgi:hypothetical protein
MKKVIILMAVLAFGLFGFTRLSSAQHVHGAMSGGSMKMDTKEVLVEGTQVTFQVMSNDEHLKMLKDMKMKEDIEPSTTHNITVTLKDEKSQKDLTGATVTMKVVDPTGKDQIKTMKYDDMMKSYDAYFDLKEMGKYQVMVLLKMGDQKKTAGIYYEVK